MGQWFSVWDSHHSPMSLINIEMCRTYSRLIQSLSLIFFTYSWIFSLYIRYTMFMAYHVRILTIISEHVFSSAKVMFIYFYKLDVIFVLLWHRSNNYVYNYFVSNFWIDFIILFCMLHEQPWFLGQFHYSYNEQSSSISLLKIISNKFTTAT